MRLKAIISFLFFIGSFLMNAQTLSETFEMAKQAEQKEDLIMASSLYNRVVFFDTLGSYPDAHYRLAQIANHNQQYAQHRNYIRKYRYHLAFNDPILIPLSYEVIMSFLMEQKNKEAIAQLLQISDQSSPKWNLYAAVAYFQDQDYSKSEAFFKLLIDQEHHPELSKIFAKNNKLDRKYRKHKLQIMSAFLPGSGQLYTGRVKDSLNSIVLLGGFLALFVHTSRVYSIVDALVSVYPWFARYYKGGVKRVPLMGEERIKLKRSQYYQRILQMVEG